MSALGPDGRRRVLAAAAALSTYAAGACATPAPEPHVGAADTEKMDYAQPASIDTADSYRVDVPRPTQRRAARNAPTPRAPQRPEAAAGDDVWAALARCESGMRQDAVSSNGLYLSYFQWTLPTWRSVGGVGDPRTVGYDTQVELAKRLQARSGWGQWPACSRKLGLR